MVTKFEFYKARAKLKYSSVCLDVVRYVQRKLTFIKINLDNHHDRASEVITLHKIENISPASFTWNTGSNFIPAVSAFGYQASFFNTGQYNTAIGYSPYGNIGIGTSTPTNSAITFNSSNNQPVLVITQDGDVEWHGKPSEAADCLVRTFQFKVEDLKGVTKAARRRYYLRACQNILNKAEKMEHAEFVAFLQKQVYNKERRVIVDSLQGTE